MALIWGHGMWTPTSIQTFDNLLSAGIVHLLLCCVWLENSVKHVGLALEKRNEEWAVSSDNANNDVKTLLHVLNKKAAIVFFKTLQSVIPEWFAPNDKIDVQ